MLPAAWHVSYFPNKLPKQQVGSHDCGPFVCEYADHICRRKLNIKFNNNHGRQIRERTVYELANNCLQSRQLYANFC